MAKSAADRALNNFEKRLRRFSKKLMQRADGRTCGTCRFYIRGLCIKHDISVNHEGAVACKQHEKRLQG